MSEENFGFTFAPGDTPFFIDPWQGKQYAREELRTFVHGDSYYTSPNGPNSMEAWMLAAADGRIRGETTDHIRNVISSYRNGDEDEDSQNLRKKVLYQAIAKAILGQTAHPGADEVEGVFDRIAFNNYVHVPMVNSATPPTNEQFRAARRVYEHELSALKPHLSLVFSRRVWNKLPTGGKPYLSGGVRLKVDGKERHMWRYDLPHGTVLVGWHRHPITFRRPNGWRDDVEVAYAKEYLRIAREFHSNCETKA